MPALISYYTERGITALDKQEFSEYCSKQFFTVRSTSKKHTHEKEHLLCCDDYPHHFFFHCVEQLDDFSWTIYFCRSRTIHGKIMYRGRDDVSRHSNCTPIGKCVLDFPRDSLSVGQYSGSHDTQRTVSLCGPCRWIFCIMVFFDLF